MRSAAIRSNLLVPEVREVMDIRQASDYLGISSDTLYKYASEGFVPPSNWATAGASSAAASTSGWTARATSTPPKPNSIPTRGSPSGRDVRPVSVVSCQLSVRLPLGYGQQDVQEIQTVDDSLCLCATDGAGVYLHLASREGAGLVFLGCGVHHVAPRQPSGREVD